ncbi:carbohydrate-binding protein [Polaribacter sp. 20A6]|uniref:carbohydrate-binding protein n=1 Tax=Polaribacter sp. 20A6 TaxID=2687289 RepID=UPI0013FDCCFB|nr:carbohydrate-binding protein [Polaribacter sp. 20A6]
MKKVLLSFVAIGFCFFANAQFVHPGLSHKISDLERMKYQVAAKLDPWYSTYQEMAKNARASYNYKVQGDTSITKYEFKNSAFDNDSRAAYYNALQWYFTGDSRHAEKSIEAMMAWTGLTDVEDRALHTSAIYIMLEAAEIIKSTYSGWSTTDMDMFKAMLVYPGYSTTVAPSSGTSTWYWSAYMFGTGGSAGNQEIAGIRAVMAMGIFLDNETMYNRALSYVTGAPHNSNDLPHNPGPPTTTTIDDQWEYRIKYNRNFDNVTDEDYHYDAYLGNYIWNTGQCEESSRDQVHTFFGIGLLCATAEMAWNQGDDVWGLLDSRLLLGLEYTQRYNLSYRQSYPDQTSPWEPEIGEGEFQFAQRISSSGLTKSLKINPNNDQNYDRLTRGEFLNEHMWELPIAHYVGRGLKDADTDAKWIVRTRDYIIEETGGFESAPNGQAYLGFGGLNFRRPDGCFGDPIVGFLNNGLPNYAMNVLPMTIEVENFDYSPIIGEGRIYSDLSSNNSESEYRIEDNVDIEACSTGGYNIKNMETGEYLTYTVNVPADGEYNIGVNYAGISGDGEISVLFGGVDKTGNVILPSTGGAQTWADLAIASSVALNKGVQSMKILVGGVSNSFNLNNISVTLAEKFDQTITFNPFPVGEIGGDNVPVVATASSGLSVSFSSSDINVASIVDGTLQINGVGTTTITATQEGNELYNAVIETQIFQVNSAGSALVVQAEDNTTNSGLKQYTGGGDTYMGNTTTGNYLLYTVNVPTTGTYLVDYRIASNSEGGSLSLQVDGVKVDNLSFPLTGGWETWDIVSSATGIELKEGEQVMRLDIDAPGWNIDWFRLSPKNTLSIGTNSQLGNNINLYPLPVSDVLHISNGEGLRMEIVNVLGELLLKKEVLNNYESININKLKAGLYLIRFTNNNIFITKKIIKK